MTQEAIARTTNRPLEIIRSTIAELEGPDLRSRTDDAAGARLRKLDEHRDWGWVIINYDRFRDVATDAQRREKTKLRTRKYREKLRENTSVTPKSSPVTHSDAAVTPPYASAYVVPEDRGVGKGGDHIEWEAAEKWLEDSQKNGSDYNRSETRSAWLALEANGWMWGRNRVGDYRAALERQIQTDRNNQRGRELQKKPNSSTVSPEQVDRLTRSIKNL
jgi:hypothetical protein